MKETAMRRLGLFVFSAILVSAHGLTVEAPAKQIQVARGRNATLHCNFKTEHPVDGTDLVVWKKTTSASDTVTRYFDGLIEYDKGYENRIQFSGNVNSGDVSITIKEVTMEDNGTYVCSVRLRNDLPGQSTIMSLIVLVAPSKPDCRILGTPQYGHTINLTCISQEGSPKPTYTWKSFNIQNQPRPLENTEGEQITLKNISADTSGFYICTSANVVGSEFCNMTVSVVPPSMNIALYAGIIGGAIAALIVIGILAYCCCCRQGGKDTDYEMTVQEERNEPSREKPTRHHSEEEDAENA